MATGRLISHTLRTKAAAWAATGLLTALLLIALSVAALDRTVLREDDWGRSGGRDDGTVALAPDPQRRTERDPSSATPGRAATGLPPSATRNASGGDGMATRAAADGSATPVVDGQSRPPAAPGEDGAIEVRAGGPQAEAAFDSDGDGLTDRFEVRVGTDPARADTDGDTLPDGWERRFGLDPVDRDDANGDSDGDGLFNRTEFRVRSNPLRLDTNADGVPDGAADADGDSLPNAIEQHLPGADPDNPDTNGDGTGDGADDADGDGLTNAAEVAGGTDPAQPEPVEPPAPVEPPPPVEPPVDPPPAEPGPVEPAPVEPEPVDPPPAEPPAAEPADPQPPDPGTDEPAAPQAGAEDPETPEP